MADNRHQVDEDRAAAGLRILEMTDQVGFDAYAAGWIHDRPTQTWRYLLSTPMLKTQGPLWVYKRLMTVFKHIPLPEGVSPLDIFVIDPDYEMALFGESIMGEYVVITGDNNTRVPIISIAQDIKFDGFSVTDGFASFYRRLTTSERKKKRDPARSFNHRVQLLQAA